MNTRLDIIPEGLPDHLPEGEQLVWHGRPDWMRLAIEAFHVRKVVGYFALVIAAKAAIGLANGETIEQAFDQAPMLALMGVAATAILAALAYMSARTTQYTLTTKRVLIRAGMALPVIINIPFRHVESISFAVTGGTRGTILFRTGGGTKLAYLLLWPHARPWHVKDPQPALRAIPDVEKVAARLAAIIGGQVTNKMPAPVEARGVLIAAE